MKKTFFRKSILFSILVLGLALSSCSFTTGAQSNATATPWIIVVTYTPTENLAPIETAVVETFSAQLTETAFANPTETPVPPTETPTITNTSTVTETPIPSNTATYWTSTPKYTKTATKEPTNSKWNCSITFQLVEDNHVFSPNEDFDGRWTIKNTGTEIWLKTDVDYRYMSGTEMQTHDKVYDLPQEVDPGESVTVIVDMKAPSSTGHYETFWALARHPAGFCVLPVRIEVRD